MDKPGKLTHIDVWGKFPVTSIDGYQYYLAFVDDYSRYTTIEGMKNKSDAMAKVKNYITYLRNRGMIPKAVRFDEGGEFPAGEL